MNNQYNVIFIPSDSSLHVMEELFLRRLDRISFLFSTDRFAAFRDMCVSGKR